jgi:chromate transporter
MNRQEVAGAAARPTAGELFLAFAGMSALGFGGVLPWARRVLVERREWLSAEEFNEVLALAQVVPGGNIINVGIIVGQRFRGLLGAVACVAGLLAAPTVIVILLAILFDRYGQIGPVRNAIHGLAAAAAGMVIAMTAKMAAPLLRRDQFLALGFAALAFVAVGIFGLPLPLALVVLTPLSVAAAWRTLR